jgi:hypothetical protein
MRRRHLGTRALPPILLVALAAALTASPAQAAPSTCTVSDAQMVWDTGADDLQGDGAVSAEGGILTFTGGTGVIEPVAPSGSVTFDGTLEYTSAAGVLTTLSTPTLVIDGGAGMLLFDVQPDGTALIPQAAVADVDLRAAAVSEEGETVNLDGVGAATDATAEGVDVLWAGTLGGLDLTVVADCVDEGSAATTAPAATAEDDTDAGGTGILVPVIVVGVAALLAGLLAIGSVQRRKRNSASVATGAAEDDPAR